jgi:hypothetical protein
MKLAEFQNEELEDTLKEAEKEGAEASRMAAQTSLVLASDAIWIPLRLNSQPQTTIMQLALLQRGENAPSKSPPASPKMNTHA